MRDVKQSKSLQASGKLFFNHFEKTVFPKHPQIEELRDWMVKEGASFSIMSGSGASVFGIFEKQSLAEQALQQAEDQFDGIRFKKVTFFKKRS